MSRDNQGQEDNHHVFDALESAKGQYESYLEVSRVYDLTQLTSRQPATTDVSNPKPLTIVLSNGTNNQYASLERIIK